MLINCDGKHGTTDNWLENQGLIIARGGAANGNGGDIATTASRLTGIRAHRRATSTTRPTARGRPG